MTTDDEADRLYRTLDWAELVLLRHAFVLDLRDLPRDAADSRAFVTGRLAAIDRALQAKRPAREP